jgi:hypothetical protein
MRRGDLPSAQRCGHTRLALIAPGVRSYQRVGQAWPSWRDGVASEDRWAVMADIFSTPAYGLARRTMSLILC